jgi:CBS domain-containing protein
MAPASVAGTGMIVLDAGRAAELMTPNPVSIRKTARIPEAISLLIDRGFGAAPVIDEAGLPIGVVSSSDILTHERERRGHAGGTGASEDQATVGDIMTPIIFSVAPDTPSAKVVQEMAALNVHRLFVVEPGGSLVGVITALDILRRLH